MKIEGPRKTTSTSKTSKAQKAKGAGSSAFSALISAASEAEAAPADISGVSAAGQIDALFALQEAADSASEEAGRKAKQRSEELLNHLESIRLGILAGSIPRRTLVELERIVAQKRESFLDPRLADIVDEIDLRVQVELAKHGEGI